MRQSASAITSRSILGAVFAALSLVIAGCGGSSQPSASATPSGQQTSDASEHETASAASEISQGDPVNAGTGTQAPEPTEVATGEPDDGAVEGNIITRSLPRFHDAFASDEAFLGWMETFHQHRDFEKTPQAIGYYCSSDLFDDYQNRIPMSDFFGAILKQDDQTVDLCYDELMLEGRVSELTVLGYALWFANTTHSRQMTFRAREIWKEESLVRMFHLTHTSKLIDSMDRPVEEDPRAVSMLWYEFFATGDEDRLRKALQYSYMHNAPEGLWQREAGQLSLEQLRRTLPYDATVRRIVEEEAASTDSTPIRTHLEAELDAAGPLRERPGTSGVAGAS